MSKKTRSIKNLLYSFLYQFLTIAFGLILPRLFIVGYGSEVNGLLNSLNQLLVYLGLFEAGVGVATMQALYRPVAEEDRDGINGVMSASNRYYKRTAKWYLAALLMLAFVYPLVVKSELDYLTICGAVIFSGLGRVVLFYFQGTYSYLLQTEGKGYISINLQSVISVLTSFAKIVLIARGVNVVAILAVAFLIQCLQTVYILIYIRKNYPWMDVHAQPDNQAIAQKNSVLVHQVSTLVFNNTDVLILTVACGLKVVSVYTLYKMVCSHLENLVGVFTNSIKFVLGQAFHVDRARFVRMIDLFESGFSALTYALFAVAAFLLLPFMRLYTAGVTDINYVDPWLVILFVGCSLLSMSRVSMQLVVDVAGHFEQTRGRSIAETLINITVSLVGVFFFGIYGVLLGTVAALLYRTNDYIIYANKVILQRKAWRSYAVYGLNLLLFFAMQFVFKAVFAEITSYVGFFAVAVAAVCMALIVFGAAHMLLFPDCRKTVWQLAKKAKNQPWPKNR